MDRVKIWGDKGLPTPPITRDSVTIEVGRVNRKCAKLEHELGTLGDERRRSSSGLSSSCN